ncbi:MAG: serine hydrolase domain-containing protein [Streptosporangiaceae bacterium]
MKRLPVVVTLWAVVTGSCLLAAIVLAPAGAGADASFAVSSAQLQRTLHRLVTMPSGPPGVIVIVRHGERRAVYQAGTASLARARKLSVDDHARLASFSKAYSGAVALSLVSRGKLRLTQTIGRLLPSLPRAWHQVTLAELLQHRSGLPDFTASKGLARRLRRAPRRPIGPRKLLRFVWHEPLQFRPGTRYAYDNTDNIVVAMMARAAAGRGYQALLRSLVYRPAGLRQTSLPSGARLPKPYLHGYVTASGHRPQDVSQSFAASLAWAAGGMVSTPSNTAAFIRAYLADRFFSARVQAAQLRFVPGSSQPPGPGVNSAGLAIFRYATRCGTVYGHTGNIPGYTQFAAATRGGADSATVTATEQISQSVQPKVLAELRQAELQAVCAALASH